MQEWTVATAPRGKPYDALIAAGLAALGPPRALDTGDFEEELEGPVHLLHDGPIYAVWRPGRRAAHVLLLSVLPDGTLIETHLGWGPSLRASRVSESADRICRTADSIADLCAVHRFSLAEQATDAVVGDLNWLLSELERRRILLLARSPAPAQPTLSPTNGLPPSLATTSPDLNWPLAVMSFGLGTTLGVLAGLTLGLAVGTPWVSSVLCVLGAIGAVAYLWRAGWHLYFL